MVIKLLLLQFLGNPLIKPRLNLCFRMQQLQLGYLQGLSNLTKDYSVNSLPTHCSELLKVSNYLNKQDIKLTLIIYIQANYLEGSNSNLNCNLNSNKVYFLKLGLRRNNR